MHPFMTPMREGGGILFMLMMLNTSGILKHSLFELIAVANSVFLFLNLQTSGGYIVNVFLSVLLDHLSFLCSNAQNILCHGTARQLISSV